MKDLEKLKEITKILLKEIGEDSNREGLIKTPDRVGSFSQEGIVQMFMTLSMELFLRKIAVK